MNAVKKYLLKDFLWALIIAGGVGVCIYLIGKISGRFFVQIFPIIFFLLFYVDTYNKYSALEMLITYFRTILLFCFLAIASLLLIISNQVIFKSYPPSQDLMFWGAITVVVAFFYILVATYSAKLEKIQYSMRNHIFFSISCLLIIYITLSFVVGLIVNIFSIDYR